MPTQVVYDKVLVHGVSVRADPQAGTVALDVAFSVAASADTTGKYALPAAVKSKSHLLDAPFDPAVLPPNPTRKDVVLALWQAMAQALAAEELA